MRTLRWTTPCDEADPLTGKHTCPYMDSMGEVDCERWCSAGSDEDYVPEEEEYVDTSVEGGW